MKTETELNGTISFSLIALRFNQGPLRYSMKSVSFLQFSVYGPSTQSQKIWSGDGLSLIMRVIFLLLNHHRFTRDFVLHPSTFLTFNTLETISRSNCFIEFLINLYTQTIVLLLKI